MAGRVHWLSFSGFFTSTLKMSLLTTGGPSGIREMFSNVSIVTIFCAKDGRIIRVNKEETFNCKNAVLQRWFGVFAAQPNGYFQKTERKRFRNLYGSVCKADYPFFRILQKPLIITVAAGIRFILEKNHKFYTFAVIESPSMRTRFFIASALLLMLAILPSCTKGSIVDIDKAESTLVVTLPDGSDVSVENALFSFMTTGSYAVFGQVTDKDQSLFLIDIYSFHNLYYKTQKCM